MISDENLKQLREMMAALLEEYGLKKPAVRQSLGAAERMRRYRDRQRNASVTRRNAKRNASHRGKRNADVTQGNEGVTPLNGNAVAYIPIVGGMEFGVSKELLTELETAYPQVDVPQTLKEMRVWCITNPSRCKTARGTPRFINKWCEKVQNGG